MRPTNDLHFKQWLQTGREQLAELRGLLPELSKAEQLDRLRRQYSRLAAIKRVCSGNAYFVGVPRPPRR